MKKITLYSPKNSEFRDYHGIPLSLLAISRFLHKEGYKIDIIEHFEADFEKKVLESCKDSICLGLTCMTGYQIKDSLRIAKIVKKAYPKLPIVWGGWHPSILPDQTMKNPYVDIVVRGQGEITFTELVHKLENKEELDGVLGASFKIKNKIIHNQDRCFTDVGDFPDLPYELIDVEKHLLNSQFGKRTIGYYSSQGCPYRCGFCADAQVYKRRYSIKSAEKIFAELKKLKDMYKIDSVAFADNNFFVNEKHTAEFCNLCIKHKLNLKFGEVDGRSNVLAGYNKKTWELMKKAGFVSILNGTESGSQEILDFITKDATVEDNVRLIELGRKYGINIICSTFIGLPTKNIQKEFKTNLDFVDKLMKINPNNSYHFFIYTPYPGSRLYNVSLENGLKEPKNLEEWSNFELLKITTPWVPKKYVKLCEQLDVYYFPILGDQLRQIINHYTGPIKIPVKIVFNCARTVVKLRWKLKFFGFPIEYHLFRLALKIKDNLSKK